VRPSVGCKTTGLVLPDVTGLRPVPEGWRHKYTGRPRDNGDTRSGANGTGGATRGSARKLSGETTRETGAHCEGWRVQETYFPLPLMPHLRVSADPRLQRGPGLTLADPPSCNVGLHPPAVAPHHVAASPKRDTSPGPPQLRREEAQPDETSMKDKGTLSWAEAQEQYSQGDMSQSSGSPVNFLDAETCENLLQDIRGADGKLHDFDSIESDPESPPPALEAEVAHVERATQTFPVPTQDQSTFVLMVRRDDVVKSVSHQSTQVISRPHQATSATQTPAPAPTSEQGTQALLRPQQSIAYTQTARPPTSTRSSWTQVPRTVTTDTGTDMPPDMGN